MRQHGDREPTHVHGRCPGARQEQWRRCWIQPRSRGVTAAAPRSRSRASGPSPLARGHLVHGVEVVALQGSIPARAGSPPSSRAWTKRSTVHPRSRGVTHALEPADLRDLGPSPLARGHQERAGGHPVAVGSIPARAGSPHRGGRAWPRRGVHPRSRGVTPRDRRGSPRGEGPSPLARGHPSPASAATIEAGSIPARAGSPAHGWSFGGLLTVHPRSRGVTATPPPVAPGPTGPSPLARGHRRDDAAAAAVVRSIPARAGSPVGRSRAGADLGVHPRSRGVTDAKADKATGERGPSPLARGHPYQCPLCAAGTGSIPARAGSPGATTAGK